MRKQIIAIILIFMLASCSNVRFLELAYGHSKNWMLLKQKEVPVPVQNAFTKKYPAVQSVQWLQPVRNKYVASFSSNGKIYLVLYSASGMVQDEEGYESDEYYYNDDFDDYWEIDRYD